MSFSNEKMIGSMLGLKLEGKHRQTLLPQSLRRTHNLILFLLDIDVYHFKVEFNFFFKCQISFLKISVKQTINRKILMITQLAFIRGIRLVLKIYL